MKKEPLLVPMKEKLGSFNWPQMEPYFLDEIAEIKPELQVKTLKSSTG